MNSATSDRIRTVLNNEVARRLLIKYFCEKGYTNFDKQIFPPDLYDLPKLIPEMSDKIEVVPHALNIDPNYDRAQLGWNLFVLGNQQQFLGMTTHSDLRSLATQLAQGQIALTENVIATKQTTPRQIVNFVMRILSSHDGGSLDLLPRRETRWLRPPQSMGRGAAATIYGRMFG